jgi:hypothetical protein
VLPLWHDLTLVRRGGHFAGGQVLHWASGTEGQPALLTGDIIMAVQDWNYVSFLYTYPNVIPLPCRRGSCAEAPLRSSRTPSSRSPVPGGTESSPVTRKLPGAARPRAPSRR